MKTFNTIQFKLFTFLVLSLMSAVTFAQSFNISAGLNLSKPNFYEEGVAAGYTESESGEGMFAMNPEYDYKYEAKDYIPFTPGFNLTLSYELNFKSKLAFETGFLFANKNYKFREFGKYESEVGGYSYDEESIIRTYYVDIPLILKFNFFNNDMFRVYGNTGLFFGVCLAGKDIYKDYYEEDGEVETSKETQSFDIDDNEFRYNAGLIGGLGIEWKGIFLESNFTLGAQNLTDMKDNQTLGNTIYINAGYKFKFGKNSKTE